ncbi:phosphate ABC transporter ATP-binding protein [Virgibacillus dakarensis]|uniref:Phosphate import ATP-binding protein PstB 1 n=1 Tax=Lentibacillus populi TaxID=1827502 RepID=A0A9W5TU04_9BACI|nr:MULTISPECIES: phosphate ABC transporter ATP-binding protein PstB [Bacillaceae]MBT2214467.1 phosphate ABC transporter ATP-binding protein [Virgibacillus dakarensis]MTW84071.1 phosphate ABC transporter ATP-binding protein [Virgibacillus dakarensis]GGB29268.1 phosphate import ATP-binding protein PstB 1 [Lentibacillus populi]
MTLVVQKKAAFAMEELNLWYERFHALKDISFQINKNEVTAIIGPSGCGKSTFIKTLNLMALRIPGVKMTGGILFENQNLVTDKTDLVHLRKKVGMIFQKGNPFPQSIYDNVAYGPRIHGIKKRCQLDEIVEEALKRVALWQEVKDRLKRNAFDLSGGQQQRLCIARAIATKPTCLLLDEPTSALDPVSTKSIEELVTELKENYTIVMVTHNMQQAARISDKTAFFLNGEVVEVNTTNKLFSNPEQKETEDYITGRFG